MVQNETNLGYKAMILYVCMHKTGKHVNDRTTQKAYS